MRPVVVGLLCLVAAAGGLWWAFGEREPLWPSGWRAAPAPQLQSSSPIEGERAAPQALASVSAEAPGQAGHQAGHSAAPPGPPAAPPAPLRPSFDIVRVGGRGEAVMAGRAAPHAEVAILDGGREIGRTRADDRGEWVFVPTGPMPPGGRELSLRSRARDGTVTESASTLVLVVPERDRDLAGRTLPAETPPPQPLALIAPRDAGGDLRLLQVPPTDPPAPLPAPAAAEPRRTDPKTASASAGDNAAAGAVAAARPEPVLSRPPAPAEPTPGQPRAPAPPPAVAAARPSATVTVDAVDYGDAGDVRFAGRAEPNAPVRLYLDTVHLGDTRADEAGRWTFAPAAVPLPPGKTAALRADQLAADGKVTARAEVPFQRAELPPEGLREGMVVVQPGHSLWRIARATYGRGVRYTIIYEANRAQIRNPNLIYPGQVFVLPRPEG